MMLSNILINEDYPLSTKFTLLTISIFSNFFSAVSGGGAGLIQLPALVIFGIPYAKALASHKIATVSLGIGGSLRNFQSLKDDVNKIFELTIIGIPGVVIGANLVNFLPETYLYLCLGAFSVVIGIYSTKKANFGLTTKLVQINLFKRIRYGIIVFLLGVLNGSVSSGSGLLVTILLINIYKIDFFKAVSLTLLSVGVFWNLAGAITLNRVGNFELDILPVLIVGSFIGGYLGANFSNLKGNLLIKKFFNIVCLTIGFALLTKGIVQLF